MLDAAMKQLALSLKDEHSLMFFARGYNYATALEAALKLKVGHSTWPWDGHACMYAGVHIIKQRQASIIMVLFHTFL